ncbi:hypothetical protein LOTGIDRAFT_108041 [Lottia gigantea]|uniref:Protein MIX23 n=1 Tax=Lottia gigantea TaxID=225164 RepID=V3ZNQ3_LOTGI|nr:hypothetical protein LOTGIDRAFT_108041 [Lottia gigantea]ESO84110.1 hypothetical protein LOTGIDRAFT_108041 [Lottia gigantea]
MRLMDDRIIYALNTSIPTESFTNKVNPATECEKLYREMLKEHESRQVVIKKCITEVSQKVNALKDQRAKDEDDMTVYKNLRKEQKMLHLMQNELNVEEVLKDRSYRTFDEKCRRVYTIPKLNV